MISIIRQSTLTYTDLEVFIFWAFIRFSKAELFLSSAKRRNNV